MQDSSTDKTMKADTTEHPPSDDAETSGNAGASGCEVTAGNVTGPAAAEEKKKKTKVMRFRMTPEHIGRVLSVRVGTRPMPTLAEGGLAGAKSYHLLDSIRNNLTEATATVYEMCEQTRLD
jgi:hypothetical protein